MNNVNTTIFCLWLQGFLDANKESSLDAQKLEEVKNQLTDVITSIKEQVITPQFNGIPQFPGMPQFHGQFPGQIQPRQ